MSENLSVIISNQCNQKKQGDPNKELSKLKQDKILKADIKKFLKSGGSIVKLSTFDSAWDDVAHKTRYNTRTKMHKPAGVGDGQG